MDTPALNTYKCTAEPSGLACAFGLVTANERRVIYVSGLISVSLDALRLDGSKVHLTLP